MRTVILIALAAMAAAPAQGQLILENHVCDRGEVGAKASKPFAETLNAASTAYGAGDHAAALNALERARPHASNNVQRSAIVQIEIAIMVGVGAEASAIRKLEAALGDPCMKRAARLTFEKMLDQARAKAGVPQQ